MEDRIETPEAIDSELRPTFKNAQEMYIFYKAIYDSQNRDKARLVNKLQVKESILKGLIGSGQNKFLKVTREFIDYMEDVTDIDLKNRTIILTLNEFIRDLMDIQTQQEESTQTIEELNLSIQAVNDARANLEEKYKETMEKNKKLEMELERFKEVTSKDHVKRIIKEMEGPRLCEICGRDISDLPERTVDCNQCFRKYMDEFKINKKTIPAEEVRENFKKRTKQRLEKERLEMEVKDENRKE